MKERRSNKAATAAITELILETFRLNGCLLEAGDELVRHLGLTSARWQVLGAVEASPVPLPVANIARNMGLSRQAVQRLANEMEKDGLARFEPNPHHERAKLVVMTDRGKAAFLSAMAKQHRWAESLAEGFSIDTIGDTARVIRRLRHKLETR
jgi:DNA-binding MarR family transcriptional regulator